MARRKTNEEFIKEVFDLVGDEYEFLDEYKNAHAKIRCKHSKCGHEWKVSPNGFLHSGCRCTDCGVGGGKAKKTNKEFVEEILYLVGHEYEFLEEYKGSKIKIKCRHNTCKHEWDIIPNSFLRGRRCPRCNATDAKSDKEFTQEVYKLVGNEYVFLEKYINAKTKVKCKHNKCGHEYEIRPTDFISGRRCPKCNASKGEIKVLEYLNKNTINNIHQYRTDDCINERLLPFDFYLTDYNLLIEYDGKQHYELVNFGGVSNEEAIENFKKTQQNDNIKNQYCKDNNIPLLRIPYWDFDNIEEILEEWLEKQGALHKNEKIA